MVKIKSEDVTAGPNDLSVPVDPLAALTWATEFRKQGYYRISNAYCMIARIDRADWLTVMAKQMNTCVANFYNTDGSGVGQRQKDYYIRTLSKDILTVHPDIVRKIPSCY